MRTNDSRLQTARVLFENYGILNCGADQLRCFGTTAIFRHRQAARKPLSAARKSDDYWRRPDGIRRD